MATVTEKKVTVNGVVNVTMEKKAILNDISGSIKHGKFTAIMGPSGRQFLFYDPNMTKDVVKPLCLTFLLEE